VSFICASFQSYQQIMKRIIVKRIPRDRRNGAKKR